MGDSVEQWRATIGQWSGGRTRKSLILHHQIEQTSNYIGYMQVRFLVLVSLLVIGCVELNPGPNNVSYVIQSNKHLCVGKGFVGIIIQVRSKKKRQLIFYLILLKIYGIVASHRGSNESRTI